MADVYDIRKWHQIITEFRDFSERHGTELEMRRFADGKEMVAIKLFYHPKGKDDEERNKDVR